MADWGSHVAKRPWSGLPDQSRNQLLEVGFRHGDTQRLRRVADIESAFQRIYQYLGKCKGILGRACIAFGSAHGSAIGDTGDASSGLVTGSCNLPSLIRCCCVKFSAGTLFAQSADLSTSKEHD
jgi:hypothetical protein